MRHLTSWCAAALLFAPPFSTAAAQEPETGDIALTRDTLEAALDGFMARGNRAGVVYVAIDGQPVLERAYGLANAELGAPMTLDTVFGIGSRPIDFTIAAIYLLEQQGRLSQDDTLADHFSDVPADRAGMTLRQLVEDRSGLPDFPADESDWDPDLAWIGRAEFERRTMAAPLLFPPGENEEHSHWGYGVLAAVVEHVSGGSYQEFLRENFFDPAGMERTGSYGETRGLALRDFAAGRGRAHGLPNIPPNWGPTSWLVMGSGGMFSTLGDLRRFYDYVTVGGALEPRYAEHFLRPAASLDGSDRGFELFNFHDEARSDQAYIFLTHGDGPGVMEPVAMPLIRFLQAN